MSPPRPWEGFPPHEVADLDLWNRFMEDEDITADCPPPENKSLSSAANTTEAMPEDVVLTASDQEKAVRFP